MAGKSGGWPEFSRERERTREERRERTVEVRGRANEIRKKELAQIDIYSMA